MSNPAKAILLRLHRRFSRVPVDASHHPAELYYAQIYLDQIGGRLAGLGGGGVRVLIAGCGTGRLTVPLARMGHHVTGIDFHRDSLRIARRNLDAAGVKAELIEADLADALRGIGDASFDAAIAIESTYVIEQFDEIMDHLARVVRPGGLLFVTHRTRYFYLTRALAHGHYDDLALIAKHNSGKLRKGTHRTFHHWETRSQIEDTYTSRGMTLLSLHGIGPCSGFGDDPLASLCDPGKLDDGRRRILREVEACDDDLLMASRYVLAIARKPG